MASIIFDNQSDTGVTFLTHRNVSVGVPSGELYVMELDPELDPYPGAYLKYHYDMLVRDINDSLELDGAFTVSYDIPSDWGSQGSVTDMKGATSGSHGSHGLAPAPKAGDQDKILLGSGEWGTSNVSGIDYVAYVEESSVSSHRYVANDQFVFSGKLYTATGVIAIGDTIVPVAMDGSTSNNGNCIESACLVCQMKPFVGTVAGLVPAPRSQDRTRVLAGDGTWRKSDFLGTQDQWDALTLQEKIQYDFADIVPLDQLGYVVHWDSPLSAYGQYLGDGDSPLSVNGGDKSIQYVDVYGDIQYADPYQVGRIVIERGSSVVLRMIAGTSEEEYSFVAWQPDPGDAGQDHGFNKSLLSVSCVPSGSIELYKKNSTSDAGYEESDGYDYYWCVTVR